MSRTFKMALLLCLVALVVSPALAKTRVACVGDSITKGYGAKPGKDYCTLLAKELGDQYSVSNHGANSRTLQRRSRKPYIGGKYHQRALGSRPNVVVIMLGTNDGKAPVNKQAFLADMKTLVESFAKLPTKPKIFLCTPLPVTGGFGIDPNRVNKEIVPLVRQAAKDLKLPLIDCYAAFEGKKGLLADGVHPSSEGAALMAKTVAAAIKAPAKKQEAPAAQAGGFPGTATAWKTGTRYDFEVNGRKAFVVVPAKMAAGKPWVWRARFSWLGKPDEALLAKGFHVAHIDVTNLYGSPKAIKHYQALYTLLTGKHGLSKRPAITAASRGGLAAHNWAARYPDRVSCIVGVAPVCNINSWPGPQGMSGGNRRDWPKCLDAYGLTAEQAATYNKGPLYTLEPVIKAKIPILHIYSPNDEMVPAPENSLAMAAKIKALGGTITLIPVTFARKDLPDVPDARAKQIASKNPHALGWAHRHTIGSYNLPAVADFILKHTR